MDTKRSVVPGALVILLGACDPSLDPASIVTTVETREAGQLALQVSDLSSGYRDAIASRVGEDDYVECERLLSVYDTRVRPIVDELGEIGPRMDDYMRMHGGDEQADSECTTSLMAAELDHHRSVACVTVGAASRNAEVRRHANVMRAYAGRLSRRSNEILLGMDTQFFEWDPILPVCRGWDVGDVCMPLMGEYCMGPILSR